MKLGNFKEIPERLGIDEKVLSRRQKSQFLTVVLQNLEKSAVKHYIEKAMLFNFVDLSILTKVKNELKRAKTI